VITCSRCGKENQDHYKFCLGCGNEIKSAAKAAARRDPLPLEPTRSGLPAASERTSVGVGADPNVLTPPPTAIPRARSGIPWNDSPQMASTGPTPAPSALAVGAGAATPSPVAITEGRTHEPWAFPHDSAAPVAAPSDSAVSTTTRSVTAEAAQPGNPCASCGRAVNPGFAFCGSCGARVAPAAAPDASGATVPRTMFMSGPAAAKVVVPRGRLVLIRPDGSEGGTYPLHDGENLVGRGQGALFDGDLYLSPRHAEFVIDGEALTIRDVRSLNGVFFRIGDEEILESGDIIRIGQELLRFEVISVPAPLEDGTEVAGTPNPGFWGRLSVIASRDSDGSAFPLFGEAVVMGRERGDILFPEDGYVSGTHAKISLRDDRVYLGDLGSSNGTFLRIRGERKLASGGFILMGQQLFRIEYR
jgi:hypothetical protein